MPEMLIAFQRPDSLSESEMREWITARARDGRPSLALRERPNRTMLRVELDAEAADEQLADLMMDMRLLGLRPSVVRAASCTPR